MPSAATAPPPLRRHLWLRRTLANSRKEAVSSALMTAACDNFLTAFAVHLRASLNQIAWLTALPQLIGAWLQVLSVWMGGHHARKRLIVIAAIMQSLVLALMAVLAVTAGPAAVHWLIVLAIGYHATLNLIQPHWRAWMGNVVPARRRGAFFAGRTRLTMLSSLLVFVGGGVLLTLSEHFGVAWLGFCLLFLTACGGRLASSYYLTLMHDPELRTPAQHSPGFGQTLSAFRKSWQDKTFRHYSIFLAGMQGVVALSAPFFAVYMLRDLGFSYLQFSLNAIASILVQFATLAYWGRISDYFGNRLVMLTTSCLLPVLPVLWTLSADFYYLLFVQAMSGLAWGGFTLSTANYLYDLRPHRANFATYAAVQSCLSATLVFVGALCGGLLATAMPELLASLPFTLTLTSPLLIVFLTSALLRLLVVLWFIPRAVEPRVRRRPELLEVIFRISRFNPISGVTLDWLTVAHKKAPPEQRQDKSIKGPRGED